MGSVPFLHYPICVRCALLNSIDRGQGFGVDELLALYTECSFWKYVSDDVIIETTDCQ